VAYITGWRIQSELLPLQWQQVDFLAGELRLLAGTTKNDEARVFPFTSELRNVLKAQHAETQQLQRKKAILVPYVFHKNGRRIKSFRKAWARACYEAGLPCVVHPKRDSKGEIVRYKEGPKQG
jgi:integrase